MKTKSTHGGARKGSGRKKKEPTKVVRVPIKAFREVQGIFKSEAQVLSGHSAVVWLDGVKGCISLDRIV